VYLSEAGDLGSAPRSRRNSVPDGDINVANTEAGVQKAQAGIQAVKACVPAAVANVVKTQVAAQDARVKAARRVLFTGSHA